MDYQKQYPIFVVHTGNQMKSKNISGRLSAFWGKGLKNTKNGKCRMNNTLLRKTVRQRERFNIQAFWPFGKKKSKCLSGCSWVHANADYWLALVGNSPIRANKKVKIFSQRRRCKMCTVKYHLKCLYLILDIQLCNVCYSCIRTEIFMNDHVTQKSMFLRQEVS